MTDDKDINKLPLPLVVQIGFAGSRQLFEAMEHPGIDAARFETEIELWLAERLRKMRIDLGLEARHFFCGVSSIAIGGDTVFCKACRANGIPLRIFLPQTRDEFLNATGSNGPDFPSKAHKDDAISLLTSEYVIQEQLVSDASKRTERFDDVNREIVRVSDVLICLKCKDTKDKPGGTEDLINRAIQHKKLVLVVQIGIEDGKLCPTEEWRLPKTNAPDPKLFRQPTVAEMFERNNLPKAPKTLAGLKLPVAEHGKTMPIEIYAGTVKDLASRTAAKMQAKFKRMAMTIIGTHIIATILAALALGFATLHLKVIPVLLGLELLMLAIGFWMHYRLHRTKTSHAWAEARLLAEVTRSVLAFGNLHVYLEHLFSLPFPAAIEPMLQTISVLQLQSTRLDTVHWTQKRDQYVEKRLTMPKNGQIDFYGHRTRESKKLLNRLNIAFIVFWISALISTMIKLSSHFSLNDQMPQKELLTVMMGTLAIVMPVLAVASLSLAAAMDLEAQEHTYGELLVFLKTQKQYIENASSERDYSRLVIETENALLGETANWFSRRSYTSVA